MIAVISFVAFTAAVGAIAWWTTRNDRMESSEAYFLAGRGLTAWVIAGSLMLTNLSTEHLIGLNGDAFNHTIAVMAWETTAALAMILGALYFVPKYLRAGLTTIPDFLATRFDNSTRVIATVLFLFSYAIAILPVVLLFGATGLEALFDVSDTLGISNSEATWLMVIGIGGLGSTYAIVGGLKAVAVSDTINGVGFLIASLLIPILALALVGDGNVLLGLDTVYTEEHAKFDITGDEPGSFLPFGVLFTGLIVNQIFFWCTNQSIMQRALGAKNLKEAQKGILIAAVFKLIAPLAIVLPGVIAYHLFKDSIGPDQYLQAYPTLVQTVLPAPLTGFFCRRNGRCSSEHIQQRLEQRRDPVQSGRVLAPVQGPCQRTTTGSGGADMLDSARGCCDSCCSRHRYQRQPLYLSATDQRDFLRSDARGDPGGTIDIESLRGGGQDRPDRRPHVVLHH